MKLLLLNLTFTFIGLVYNKSPLDLTNGTFEGVFSILTLISTLTLSALTVHTLNIQGTLKKWVTATGLLFLVIYVSWAIFVGNKNYEDIEIISVDPTNSKHKIIKQYLDEGAIGGHNRTVKVLEILPGLRYIESISD